MRNAANIVKQYPLPIVGGTAFGRYAKTSTEETFNMMISDDTLVPYPGYRKIVDLGGVGRDLFVSNKNQHLFAVVDDTLFSIGANNEVSEISQLLTSTGDVFMAENDGNQIGIVDGLTVYTFNYATDSFTTVTGLDFLPNYIGFQDTYFIASGVNETGQTNAWRLCDFNNGNSWPSDASHTGELQSKADATVATVPFNRQVYVFGKIVTEIWYDNTFYSSSFSTPVTQLFPYQRNNYYTIDYGCINAATIAVGSINLGQNNLVPLICWLGINEKAGATIMYSTGGQSSQLSTDGINFRIDKLEHPEVAYGFIFRQAGHTIYQIVWPMDNVSYAYDFNINKFVTVTDHNLDFHIAKRVAFFNNKYYFLSATDGGLYEMAADIYTYDGNEVPRIRIPPPFRLPDSSPFIVNYAELVMEQGDSQTEQAIDLSLSIDGGLTYGSSGRTVLNPLGNRLNRYRERNLGMANDFRLQYRFWGFEKFVITSGVLGVYQ